MISQDSLLGPEVDFDDPSCVIVHSHAPSDRDADDNILPFSQNPESHK